MDTYSINPDNFKLCILEKGNSTDYYDFNENLISGMSTSTGGNVRELDYQTIMQNYGLPFNFSTVLHMTALDVDFMKEFLKMAIKENETNPIILTYVESSSTTTQWKDYTGHKSVKYELKTEELDEKVPIILEGDTNSEDYEKPQDEFITINNDYMNNNYSSYYYKQQITTNSGALYVTKADTWLKTTSKEISELQTPIVDGGSETNPGVIDYYNEYAKIVGNGQKLITKTKIYVTETITTETETRRYIVTDGEDKVNVDDFINLIKKYTDVGGNLVSSDYIILTRLQQYENTQKLEKVMRYVLSMLSGDNYGVSEADVNILINDLFTSNNGIYGNTTESKVWFALRNAGFSEEAVAGIMGNIEAESNFVPSKEEVGGGGGYGLCQWTGDRRTQLENYAASKGVAPSDVETQIEILLAEITPEEDPENIAEQYTDFQFNSKSDYEEWRDAETPEDAAVIFCRTWERAGVERLDERKKYAREFYDYFTGLGDANERQLLIVEIASNSESYGIEATAGYCLGWAYDVYEEAGEVRGTKNCASCAGYYYGVSDDFSNIPLGAAVFSSSASSGSSDGELFGHVGIYVGEGKIANNVGGVVFTTVEEWLNTERGVCWGWLSEEPINENYPITQGLISKGRGENCH